MAGLVGLLVLAAVLRAGPLGPSSLWLDDAWVALVGRAESFGELWTMGFTFPGFALLLRGWFGPLGFSETTAQALPFAFGVVGPPALFVVCMRRGLPVGAALVAGGLLAVSPVHLEYSSRVKSYTLDALLAVLLLGAGWAVVQQPRSGRRWAGAVVAAALAIMLSAAVAPYAVALVVAGLVAGGGRLAVTAGAVLAAFGLVWWALVLDRAVNEGLRDFWTDFYVDGVGDAVDGLRRVFDGFAPGPAWLAAAVVVLAAVALALRGRGALLALVGVPVVVAVALAVLDLAPLGGGRTDTFLFPALAVTVGAALSDLPAVRGWPGAVGAAVVVAVLAVAAPGAGPYPAEDVSPLIAFVESERADGDAVLVYPATRWAYALYTSSELDFERDTDDAPGYRAEIAHDTHHVHVLPPAGREEAVRYELTVQEVAGGHDRVWLLASHWRSDLADLRDALAAFGLHEQDRWERPGAQLSLWAR